MLGADNESSGRPASGHPAGRQAQRRQSQSRHLRRRESSNGARQHRAAAGCWRGTSAALCNDARLLQRGEGRHGGLMQESGGKKCEDKTNRQMQSTRRAVHVVTRAGFLSLAFLKKRDAEFADLMHMSVVCNNNCSLPSEFIYLFIYFMIETQPDAVSH